MATMVAPIVTPVNSKDHNDDNHELLMKIHSGLELEESDWEQIEHEKRRISVVNKTVLENTSAGSLVRVRGMVQDMFDAEYFSTCPTSPSYGGGSYGETLGERTSLFISPIPFTSPWFQEKIDEEYIGGDEEDQHRDKRRCLREDEAAEYWPHTRMQTAPHAVPFVAKLYYEQYPDQTSSKLRLNDLVELVGVLEWENNPDSPDSASQTSSFQMCQELETSVVPKTVPRLHVLWYKPFTMDALVGRNPSFCPDPGAVLAKSLSVSDTAARLLWMTLLSAAERSRESDTDEHLAPISTPGSEITLGCLSTQLILPNVEACHILQEHLSTVLPLICPSVHVWKVTPDTLCQAPGKMQGRIHPSPMQMPRGSTIVLNVGEIGACQLKGKQVQTLQSLQYLAMKHKVPYEFDGQLVIPFEADVRVIVISTPCTRKLIPCHSNMKCSPGPDINMNISNLENLRYQLAAARVMSNIGLQGRVLERAQQDFIQRRAQARQNQQSYTEQDLHRWLTMTRLAARHRGVQKAEIVDWESALHLDDSIQSSS